MHNKNEGKDKVLPAMRCEDGRGMKQVAEYIIPIIQDGKNCVPDFLQAKELIRCRDCKHRIMFPSENVYKCLFSDSIVPEHYCGYAERKETS